MSQGNPRKEGPVLVEGPLAKVDIAILECPPYGVAEFLVMASADCKQWWELHLLHARGLGMNTILLGSLQGAAWLEVFAHTNGSERILYTMNITFPKPAGPNEPPVGRGTEGSGEGLLPPRAPGEGGGPDQENESESSAPPA